MANFLQFSSNVAKFLFLEGEGQEHVFDLGQKLRLGSFQAFLKQIQS